MMFSMFSKSVLKNGFQKQEPNRPKIKSKKKRTREKGTPAHLYEFQDKEEQRKESGVNAYGMHEIDAAFGINSSSPSYLDSNQLDLLNINKRQMVSSDIPVIH